MKKTKLICSMVLMVFCFKQGISQNSQKQLLFSKKESKGIQVYEIPLITEDSVKKNNRVLKMKMKGNVLLSFTQYDSIYEIGTHFYFYENGMIKRIEQYDTLQKCKDYPEKYFADTTDYYLHSFGYYVYPRIGKWMYFSKEGYLLREEYYKNEFSEECGCVEKKVGVWKYYNIKGRVIRTISFED
jgi:antitoxin component YwqK of YwqJK toxin-antitoxin module